MCTCFGTQQRYSITFTNGRNSSKNTKKRNQLYYKRLRFFCDPGRARTVDPMIKSHLLYQLSYGVMVVCRTGAKVRLLL